MLDVRPRILVFYVVSGCDCRCAMCEIWQDRRQLTLDPAAVAREIGAWRAAGLERCVLSGGEPLRHPRLPELLDAFAGTPCTLLTSGIALAERSALLAGGTVDDVIVSLDGPPDLHDRIRGRGDAFERLRAGVAALRRVAPELRVSGRCTVQARNCGALRATVATAHELGLDGLSFLAVDTHSTAFNRGSASTAAGVHLLLPGLREIELLEVELDRLEREHGSDLDSGFIVESAAKLRRRLLAHFRAELGLGPRLPVTCNAPWVSAVVETDGSLRPCFFQPAAGRWDPEAMPLLEAWRGPTAAAARDGLDVATDPTCQRCVCNLNLR